MAFQRSRRAALVAALLAVAACSEPDSAEVAPAEVCRSEASAESGLRVTMVGDAYVYANDLNGAQRGYAQSGDLVALPAGEYRAVLNGTTYPVAVEAGRVTTCDVATLEVAGTTDEYYYVLDTLGAQLTYAKLGDPLALFGGRYFVRVNDTRAAADLQPADTTVLSTGTIVGAGNTDEYYYVLDPSGNQLTYAKLGQQLSLLPGSYLARVNDSRAPFTIRAGEPTTVTAGAVLATGTTDSYYYVLDTLNTQLGYAKLGDTTSYLPGTYRLRVLDVATPLTIDAGKVTELVTGTLEVAGPSDAYYYVLDEAGAQLGYAHPGEATALLPGSYRVRLGERTEPVTILASQTTSLGP